MSQTWQEHISFEEFRTRGPELLAMLEQRGFRRREDLELTREKSSGLLSTLIYMATNRAFVFTLDYKDQVVDSHIVAVRDGKPLETYESGYDTSIYGNHYGIEGSYRTSHWWNLGSAEYKGKSWLEAILIRDIRFLTTVGESLLHDDSIPVEVIRERTDREHKDWLHAHNLECSRIDSRVAWTAKDYVSFAALLEPFRKDLTPVELKKLEFAQTKVKEGMSGGRK